MNDMSDMSDWGEWSRQAVAEMQARNDQPERQIALAPFARDLALTELEYYWVARYTTSGGAA
jgi:hypothetical protein